MTKRTGIITKPVTLTLLSCLSIAATAQISTHTGCVNPWPEDSKKLTLSEGSSCSVLKGKLATLKLTGHTVKLSGSVIDGTAAEPQSLTIESVEQVGEACTNTCSPQPPGHRGMFKKEKPGAQGGTPGRQSEPTPP